MAPQPQRNGTPSVQELILARETPFPSPCVFLMKRILRISAYILLIAVSVFISCQKKLSCYDCDNNKPPVANAGPDQKIMLPASSVHLDGSKSADPDNHILKYAWVKIYGTST